MTIINHLDSTVTPAILGNSGGAAHQNLLEQFYAILVNRLALPEVITQLQRYDSLVEPAPSNLLFEQIWSEPSQRQLLIHELAGTHHIDAATTEQLVNHATPLAFKELNILANNQPLPPFLQLRLNEIRPYLPAWAGAVIGLTRVPEPVVTEVIHTVAAVPESRAEIRARNQRNDMMVRLLLLVAGLLALLLLWWLFLREPSEEPVETVAINPAATAPETVTPVAVVTPAQLVVGVDDAGNLYTCSATVGDDNLKAQLQQALTTSFGAQASICDISVRSGVATTLTNINVETLPNVLTLMRSAPFSRFQLQNDSISLEAPDETQLQRLLVDVQAIVPTVTITTARPVVATTTVTQAAPAPTVVYENTAPTPNPVTIVNPAPQQSVPVTTPSNQVAPVNNSPQPVTNNTITPAPAPPPQSSISNTSMPQNNRPANGQLSQAEVDDIANTTIIADPVRNVNQNNPQ
ncbi:MULTISPECIES: hypothetical protein [Psychrobacter]|uniref:hypothetical protein n=1 Tax=Psychrobacter TaxID=497 RepID=UPI00146C8BBF|nr:MULTISPECIES: hypothetical protein [Psychrobacter]